MKLKQQYLDQLRTNLRKYPSGTVDDYIDYYDELITERVASGEKESAVLEQLGSPKDIASSFKQDNAIDRAVKKPTASNGIRALIAVLGVLSLPLLIPFVAVLIALVVVAAALFISGMAVSFAGIAAALAGVIDMASITLSGDAPWYLLLLTTGIALIVIFLAFEFGRALLFAARWTIRTLIHKLSTRRNTRKEQ